MTAAIESIEVYVVKCPVDEYSDARNRITVRDTMWLRLRDSDGAIGWGEAAVWGGPPETTVSMIADELFPIVAGLDPSSIHHVWEAMYQKTLMHGRGGIVLAAMSGIDIALWDMLARKCGRPLVEVLGRHSTHVRPYASAGFYAPGKSINDLREEYARLVSKGFSAFKMKVGRQERNWNRLWDRPYAATIGEDIERVHAVRSEIGPDSILLIDANTEWDATTAIRFLNEVADADIFFLEEAVGPDFGNHAARIREHSGSVRVAGFETEYGRYAYRDLIAQGALDVVQPDACWCGGVSESRRIAAYASAHGLLCVPHSISSAFSMLVNAHVVASLDNGFLVEWDGTGNPLMDRFFDPQSALIDGLFEIPSTPGIGLGEELLDFGAEMEHVRTLERSAL